MEEFLILLLQVFFEAFLEVFLNILLDWPRQNYLTAKHEEGIAYSCMRWLAFGGLLGGGSLYFFPRSWISLSALRIANLILAPLLSAYSAEAVARYRQKNHEWIVPRYHFWKSFWFILAFVSIRFAFVAKT